MGEKLKRLEEEVEKLKAENRILQEERDDFRNRLSKLAGEKLTQDNPAITDLSDRNRPTKLGEMYNELYDNQWTDAFEGIVKDGKSEADAINVLYHTLFDCYTFCDTKAKLLMKRASDAVNDLFVEYKTRVAGASHSQKISSSKTIHFPVKQSHRPSVPIDLTEAIQKMNVEMRWKKSSTVYNKSTTLVTGPVDVEEQMKRLRKEVAESMVPVVQKAYLDAKWVPVECVEELKPFIKECIYICWMMVVQTPPMSLVFLKGAASQQFDDNKYKPYNKRGSRIAFVVWPVLLLHEGGPMVCKGVASTAE